MFLSETLQAANSSAGWSNTQLALTGAAALAMVFLPAALVAAAGIITERRFGPRRLPLLWLATVVLLQAYFWANMARAPERQLALVGGSVGPASLALLAFLFVALPCAVALVVAWRLGRRAREAGRQPGIGQIVGTFAAYVLAVPLAIVAGVAGELLGVI